MSSKMVRQCGIRRAAGGNSIHHLLCELGRQLSQFPGGVWRNLTLHIHIIILAESSMGVLLPSLERLTFALRLRPKGSRFYVLD